MLAQVKGAPLLSWVVRRKTMHLDYEESACRRVERDQPKGVHHVCDQEFHVFTVVGFVHHPQRAGQGICRPGQVGFVRPRCFGGNAAFLIVKDYAITLHDDAGAGVDAFANHQPEFVQHRIVFEKIPGLLQRIELFN